MSVAAALARIWLSDNGPVAAVISGGNVDPEPLRSAA